MLLQNKRDMYITKKINKVFIIIIIIIAIIITIIITIIIIIIQHPPCINQIYSMSNSPT